MVKKFHLSGRRACRAFWVAVEVGASLATSQRRKGCGCHSTTPFRCLVLVVNWLQRLTTRPHWCRPREGVQSEPYPIWVRMKRSYKATTPGHSSGVQVCCKFKKYVGSVAVVTRRTLTASSLDHTATGLLNNSRVATVATTVATFSTRVGD